MKYYELLNSIIEKSNMSLRDISNKCKGLGEDVSAAYLSLLKTGKAPAPSSDISRTIAKVCDRTRMYELVFMGYMEKAPDEIYKYISLLKKTNENLTKYITDEHSFIEYRSLAKEIEELDRLNFQFNFSQKINDNDISEYSKKLMMQYSSKREDEYSKYFMVDDSMEPLIPRNSKLQIVEYEPSSFKFLDRDIIIYSPIGTDAYKIRRIYIKKNNILLIPENKKYDIDIINNIEDVNVIGKVNYYKASIR